MMASCGLILFTLFVLNVQQLTNCLYTSSDSVNILTRSNFSSFTVDQHHDGLKMHFVHFYASWCPHCRSFAPKFKEFLAQTAGWRKLIDFSVISCSDDFEKWDSICDKYQVSSIPQFRLFWFDPSVSDVGINVIRK